MELRRRGVRRIRREQARDALHRSLERRGGSPVGTPLRDLYARDNPAARPVETRTFWGAEMQVVLPELVSCEIHAYGLIEPALSAFFIEAIDSGTTVYDVGAHLGYYSLLAAALGGDVHAFEPSRDTVEILEANVVGAATVVPAAAWSGDGTLRLKDFGAAHSAVNTFLSSKDEDLVAPEVEYDVRALTLDGYARTTGTVPQLIKIDAEGAELQVLQGARETVRAVSPVISIEVGDTSRERTSRRAIDLAIDLGYVPYDLTGEGLRRHDLRDVYGHGNVLLVPAGAPRAASLTEALWRGR
ncbi:MAG: FkbM family methyltransferase [Actinomycetota bacterium]